MLLANAIFTGQVSVLSLEMQLSIDKVFEKPLIRSVFKSDSEKLLSYGVVSMIVTKFLESFGFSAKPSQSLIDNVTADTLFKFQYETLDDVVIFYKMCRQGDFGSTFRGIDSNLIFGDWLPKYLELKSEKQQRYSDTPTNNKIENNAVEQFYANRRKKLAFEKKRNQVEDEIDEMVKNMDRQMLEDLITEWENNAEMKPYLPHLKLKRKLLKTK